MSLRRLAGLTALTMCAFASNSVLCRLALSTGAIDPASFTLVRVASGATALVLISRARAGRPGGDWTGAVALFAYAAAFSFAYVHLTTGTGALLLFGAVQLTMMGHGITRGERPSAAAVAGAVMAMGGLVLLVAPGLTAPPPAAAALMLGAGVAWGVYSVHGRGSRDPMADTAGNFTRAVPLALLPFAVVGVESTSMTPAGLGLAVASGAAASGAGYAIWYSVLPQLRSSSAAVVQLIVPVLAAAAGVLLLGESITWRLVSSAAITLGGIWLALAGRRARARTAEPALRR